MPRECLLTAAYLRLLWRWRRVMLARNKCRALGFPTVTSNSVLEEGHEEEEEEIVIHDFKDTTEALEILDQAIKLMRGMYFQDCG
jgi:hypothetical protein